MIPFFSPEGTYPPAGMFTPAHFLAIGICFLFILTVLFFNRNISKENLRRLTLAVAILFTLLEILKIIYKFAVNHTQLRYIDSYFPLSFCSLFIYMTWFAGCKNKKANRIGEMFLACGALTGGASFLLVPSTSLMIAPIWHFLSVHSLFYHSVMVCLSILYIKTGRFKPSLKQYFSYCGFLLCVMIPTQIFNFVTHFFNLTGPGKGANLMMLNNPFNIPFSWVNAIYENTPYLYPVFVMAIYCMTYLPSLGIYHLFRKAGAIRK